MEIKGNKKKGERAGPRRGPSAWPTWLSGHAASPRSGGSRLPSATLHVRGGQKNGGLGTHRRLAAGGDGEVGAGQWRVEAPKRAYRGTSRGSLQLVQPLLPVVLRSQ
jgi:hypothetical protein